jgi:hypothetical protein
MSRSTPEEVLQQRKALQTVQWENYLRWKKRPDVQTKLKDFKYMQELLPSSPHDTWGVYFSLTASHLKADLIGVTAASSPHLSLPRIPMYVHNATRRCANDDAVQMLTMVRVCVCV